MSSRPSLSVTADPSLFLPALGSQANIPAAVGETWNTWGREVRGLAVTDSHNVTTQLETIVSNILLTLEEYSDQAHVVATGLTVEQFSHLFHPRFSYGWLESGPFGSESASAGYALASSLLFERREIWILDASRNPSRALGELSFMIANKLPAVFVLFHETSANLGPILIPESFKEQLTILAITKETECIPTVKAAQESMKQGKTVIVNYIDIEVKGSQ